MEISDQVNSQWFTVLQAANKFRIDVKGMRKLYVRYSKYLGENIKQVISKGRTGKTIHINQQGLLILANLKNPANNSNRSSEASLQGKKKVVEIAIAAVTPSIDPVILQLQQLMVVRQEQINQSKRIDTIETKIEEVKQLALVAPPIAMVTSQREFLNDRLRNFCAQSGMSHSYVWNRLHEYVGKYSINEYKFEDYKPAIQYLKQMYQDSNLIWS